MKIAVYLQNIYDQLLSCSFSLYADVSASAARVLPLQHGLNLSDAEHDQLLALVLFGLTISVFLLIAGIMALRPKEDQENLTVQEVNQKVIFPQYAYSSTESNRIKTAVMKGN